MTRKKSMKFNERSIVLPPLTIKTNKIHNDIDDDDAMDSMGMFDFSSSAQTQLIEKGIYYISGEIFDGSLLSIQQDLLLKHLNPNWKDDVQIFINSPGGDVHEAWALIDMIKLVRMNVWTTGMGLVASAGALLLAAGDEGMRRVVPNTHIMVHQFWTMVGGNYSQLAAESKSQQQEWQRHLEFWFEHSACLTKEEVEKKLLGPTDTNLTPQDAIELGIVDEILQSPKSRTSKTTIDIKKKSTKRV